MENHPTYERAVSCYAKQLASETVVINVVDKRTFHRAPSQAVRSLSQQQFSAYFVVLDTEGPGRSMISIHFCDVKFHPIFAIH